MMNDLKEESCEKQEVAWAKTSIANRGIFVKWATYTFLTLNY